MTPQMNTTRAAVILGLLAAVGPFAIDMYLPALPALATDLGTSAAAAQATLSVFFLAFGLSQIFYGPVADAVGRRPPLYFGLGLYIIGALCSAAAPTIGWLIGARLVQGVGAAATMVMPRAVVRDMVTGVEATRLMGFIMLVLSVSPILAPAVGGILVSWISWRAIFVSLLVAAAVALALVRFALPETLSRENRTPLHLGAVLRSYGELLTHPRFLGLTFIGGSGMAAFFAFLSTSPFLFIEHYGLSANQFSLCFGLNAGVFIGVSQLAAPLAGRFGVEAVVKVAVVGFVGFAFLMALVFGLGAQSLFLFIPMLMAAFGCLGLVIGPTAVLSLDEQGERAGLASALGGALQMVCGMASIGLVSLLPKDDAKWLAFAIAGAAAITGVLTVFTLGGAGRTRAANALAE